MIEENNNKMSAADIKLCVFLLFVLAAIVMGIRVKHNTPEVPIKDITEKAESTDTAQQSDTAIDIERELLHKKRVFEAFCWVESNHNCLAKSRDGKYIGCAQIGLSAVRLANDIVGEKIYTSGDRYTYEGSYAIFTTIMDALNPTYNLLKACNIWNGRAGVWYYERVLTAYNENRAWR